MALRCQGRDLRGKSLPGRGVTIRGEIRIDADAVGQECQRRATGGERRVGPAVSRKPLDGCWLGALVDNDEVERNGRECRPIGGGLIRSRHRTHSLALGLGLGELRRSSALASVSTGFTATPDRPLTRTSRKQKGTSWRTGQRWALRERGFPPAPLSLTLEFSTKLGKDFAL